MKQTTTTELRDKYMSLVTTPNRNEAELFTLGNSYIESLHRDKRRLVNLAVLGGSHGHFNLSQELARLDAEIHIAAELYWDTDGIEDTRNDTTQGE